ncbi:MAG: DUF362 domain-containing protein [Verrucomicrobiota bacterium]|jgi:uncharacterized protein (DUF362 family)
MRNQRANPSALAKVVVTSVVDFTALEAAFGAALTQAPELLPRSLPARVVIKPNLCDNAAWETGATTDPAWLGVLARALRARRPDVVIDVVESDAISMYRAFRACDESFERLGYVEAAREAGVRLINLSREESWEIQVPTFPEPVRIPALFLEEFFLISLANVKLHPYERFTGILKNNYGLLPQSDRSGLHMRLPEILFTVHQLCRTDLAILDGRIGLEGKGPIFGRPKRLNRLVVSNDALAADQTACRLIGLEPDTVPHLRYAAQQSGQKREEVEVHGHLTPSPFTVDDPETVSLIIRKFALRRFHRRLEKHSERAMNWAAEAWHHPLGFAGRVARRVFARK